MADETSIPSPRSDHRRASKEELQGLIAIIKRNLSYGQDKAASIERKIKQSKGDLNKEKILLLYATESPFLSPEVVKCFLELGSRVNDQDDQGRTILNWSIILDVGVVEEEDEIVTDDATKLELIDCLVAKGADVTLSDDDGNDPLKLSLISGQPEFIITRFIELIKQTKTSEETINRKNNSGFTALHLMLLSEVNANVILLSQLLASEADPNLVDDENQNNALHWLFHAYPYPANNSKYNQEARNQVHDRYNFQKYPILFYLASGPKQCFDLLLDHGTDVNHINKHGKVPFELALSSPGPLNLYILKKLIPTEGELVESVNSRESGAQSILKTLLKKDMRQIDMEEFQSFIESLLEVGCNIKQVGLLCDSIHNFRFKYHMIEFLVSKGMTITVQDIKESIEMRRLDVSRLLLEKISKDPEKKMEIQSNHPDILIRAVGPFEWGAFDDELHCTTLDLIKLLLEEFKIDVNYSSKDSFVLHSLVKEYPSDSIQILEYLIQNYPTLDINREVAMSSVLKTPWDGTTDEDEVDGEEVLKGTSCLKLDDDDDDDDDNVWESCDDDALDENDDFQKKPESEDIVKKLERLKLENIEKLEAIEEVEDSRVRVPSTEAVPEEESVFLENGTEVTTPKPQPLKILNLRVLELALKDGHFDFASILLRNFASVQGLVAPSPTSQGFSECYQLLYQLNVPMVIGSLSVSRGVRKELDWFEEWIEKDKSTVKSLTKLSALAVRRKVATQDDIDFITEQYLLPEVVQDMLILKGQQDTYVKDFDYDPYSDDSDEYDDEYDDDSDGFDPEDYFHDHGYQDPDHFGNPYEYNYEYDDWGDEEGEVGFNFHFGAAIDGDEEDGDVAGLDEDWE